MSTWSLLDAAHQQALASNANANDIIAAISARVPFEQNKDGWQSTDVATAQAIIDTEASWLPTAIANKINAINAARDARIAAGMSYQGVIYQIDQASQQNITAMASLAQVAQAGGTTWPSGFYWVAADNSHHPMTAPQMIAFAAAAAAYVSAIVLNTRALKDACAAAQSAAALNAIDITAGWPAGS